MDKLKCFPSPVVEGAETGRRASQLFRANTPKTPCRGPERASLAEDPYQINLSTSWSRLGVFAWPWLPVISPKVPSFTPESGALNWG
jgi:hypothetical protein